MTKVLLALGLALAVLTGCGGDSEGMRCDGDGDCDDGQICAQLATCAGEDCPAICGRPCSTVEDCEDGEVCAEVSGSGGRICQDSRDETDL